MERLTFDPTAFCGFLCSAEAAESKTTFPNLLSGMPVISQSCLTLCDAMDCSPPDSSVHGVLHSALPSMHARVRFEFKTQLNDERKCTPDIHFAPEIWPMWHASGITVSGRRSLISEWQQGERFLPSAGGEAASWFPRLLTLVEKTLSLGGQFLWCSGVFWEYYSKLSSAYLTSSSAFAFNLSQHQSLFQWVSSSYQVAKVLEL